jgi:NAD+ kinase
MLRANHVKADSHIEEKTVDLDNTSRSRNGSLSSGDGQEQMEVVGPTDFSPGLTLTQPQVFLGDEGIHRRKSSLVSSAALRPTTARRKTQCFVHTLLEKHDGTRVDDHDTSYEGLAQERRIDKDPYGHAEQSHHSRLLTKKQISDMAVGIRELSKKLAQIRLKLKVRNIFILGKAHDETLISHTREMTDWLLTTDPKYKVYGF